METDGEVRRDRKEGGMLYRWFACIVLSLPVVAVAGNTITVNVQKSTVYVAPRFFSDPVARVSYGEKLEMLGESKDWVLVRVDQRKGWIHRSAVMSAKAGLGAILFGGPSEPADEDEVALAGKGFTPEIERHYEETHPEVNYALVDEIESFVVSEGSLRKFIHEGGLQVMEDQ
jgi:hypothetical protein